MTDVRDLLPGEQVLWRGRPAWPALARDVLHLRWVALYFAVFLIWGAALDRRAGTGSLQTMLNAVPLLLVGAVIVAACAGLAWALARTTEYTLTSERLMLRYGLALTATLSLPLRQIATVSVSLNGESGDIAVVPKSGRRIAFFKLWPHVRPWHVARPEPMLRGVPGAAQVGALLAQAVASVAPGRIAAMPDPKATSTRASRPVAAATAAAD